MKLRIGRISLVMLFGFGMAYIVHAMPPLPDFVITDVSIPAEIVEGMKITVNVTVENQGTAAGDGMYLDLWQNLTNGWPQVGEVGEAWETVGVLAPGESRTLAVWPPIEALAGTNHICTVIEFENRVSETVNTNNHFCTDYFANPIPTNVVPVYRFYSPVFRGHFFTISAPEKTNIIENLSRDWRYEGIAYYVPAAAEPGTKPVYRFWSSRYRGHFFTMSAAEKTNIVENLSSDWRYEGIAYNAYPFQVKETLPVYRFWSPRNRHHFFTIFEVEKNNIIANLSHDWNYETISYYAFRRPPTATTNVVSSGNVPASMPSTDMFIPTDMPISESGGVQESVLLPDLSTSEPAYLTPRITESGEEELVVSPEDSVSFPILSADVSLSAYVYDSTADVLTNLLENTASVKNIVFSGIIPEHDYWLDVLVNDTNAGTILEHASCFERSFIPPDYLPVSKAVETDPSGMVGTPVERVRMPEVEGPMTVKLYSTSKGVVQTLENVYGGEVVELQINEWNSWHWVGAWRASDDQLVFSLWLRHTFVE